MKLLDTDMSHWGPGVRHYQTGDGYAAVSVDAGVTLETKALIDETLTTLGVPTLESGIHRVVVEPTVVISCNADGVATDLTPLRTFPPGTSHEDAIAQLEE